MLLSCEHSLMWWSYKCSPVVMTTMSNTKSMLLLLQLYSSCQTSCASIVIIVGYTCSCKVVRIEIVRKVVRIGSNTVYYYCYLAKQA